MYVFYDTETTGTNTTFDQILQFAAILTDDDLNIVERFEVRCQILPWVIPAVGALKVTGIAPAMLTDPSHPDFYSMMTGIRAKLESWSPAIFVGYNTIKFDEPLLQRAFWQTLHPAYLTVTNGNSRMDLLPLVRAASHLAPNALAIPLNEKGGHVFKLDRLAPSNGFNHDRAHDALGDVEATIHIAKLLADRVPGLWQTASKRSSKRETSNALSTTEPTLVVEYFGKPVVWWGQRLDDDGASGRSGRLADLGRDWTRIDEMGDEDLAKWGAKSPKALRSVALNKAPVIFTLAQADTLWGLRPDSDVLSKSARLNRDAAFRRRLARAHEAGVAKWPEPEHLEQMIYEKFPTRSDETFMARFHQSDWRGRVEVSGQFDDPRYRSLAQRLVYLNAPQILAREEVDRIEAGISDRVWSDHTDKKLWRTLAAARTELEDLMGSEPSLQLAPDYEEYLDALGSRYTQPGKS